ncbi:MAG: FHA domain-containing protein, partial [Planctomycetota bacterium]
STSAGGLSPDAAQRAAAAGVGDVGGWGGGGGGLARDPDLATLDLELPPAPTASALTAPNALTLLPALAPAASAREAAAGVSSAAVAAASGVAGSAALAVKGSGAIAPRADRAWLRLTWQEAPTPIDLAIFAAPTVTFGRASDGSVDLPLRLYPVAERKAECMQISSQHARFARTAAGWNLTDLHSHNGLTLNETRLAADLPVDLPNGAVIGLGGALQLRARLVRPAVPAQFRLDGQPFAPADPAALLLERLGNRADLVYALLADRLPIGGTDPRQALAAALPTSRSCGTLWWHAQQFWWQPVEPQTVEGRRVLPDQLAPLPSEALCWSAGPYTLVFRPLTLDLFR